MKRGYDPVKGTSDDDQPEDDAVYAWYDGSRSSSGMTCPICFGMVATVIATARGHMEWHRSRGEL